MDKLIFINPTMSNTKCIKIKDLKDLIKLSTGKSLECFIALNFGIISCKNVKYLPKTNSFKIYNYADDSDQRLRAEQLWTKSNIGKALDKGALFFKQ